MTSAFLSFRLGSRPLVAELLFNGHNMWPHISYYVCVDIVDNGTLMQSINLYMLCIGSTVSIVCTVSVTSGGTVVKVQGLGYFPFNNINARPAVWYFSSFQSL